jgi:DNA-binding NtrC family response regulator
MARSIHWEVVPIAQVPREDLEDGMSLRPVVLVVDDEPMVADTLATILSQAGFEARAAYDATDALQTAREKPPGFLLTDVWMPGMNGIELAMQMAREFPGCSILLFSGNASMADLEGARRAGYEFPLMAKPVHPAQLVRYIANCFDGERSSADRPELAEMSMWETVRRRAS